MATTMVTLATAERADDAEVAVPMSLSRRLLSLPQELEGVSLPPQVAGDRHGVLTLAVPHILESAAAPRALPPVSLVRVRWWGEEKPGSLFRPALLSPSAPDGPNARLGSNESPFAISPRTITMRYPVHAPADSLLEYFRDMKALQMDVIDRVTRKKFGYCSLSLQVQDSASMAGVRAEDRLATLRMENALCEIVSTDPREEGAVLGYLAVDFGIEWADNVRSIDLDASPPPNDGTIAATDSTVLVASSPADTSTIERPIGASSISSSLRKRGGDSASSTPWSGEDKQSIYFLAEDSTPGTPDPSKVSFADAHESRSISTTSIQQLIERGKALQQRMDQAVQFVDYVDSGQPTQAYALPELPTAAAWNGEYRAEVRPSSLYQNAVGYVPTSSPRQGGEATSASEFFRPSDTLHAENEANADDSDGKADAAAKAHVDSMEMTFEQLEFDRELIEQLRQLRDPSSVTSRFSPIKITVVHTDITSLFAADEAQSIGIPQCDGDSTAAFSVTTSLRKRQWRPNCSKVSRVEIGASPDSTDNWSSVRRVPENRLAFRVICENQSDAARQARRQERGLFPLPAKSIELHGSVGASELLDRMLRSDAWATQISLFLVEDKGQTSSPANGRVKARPKRRAARHSVGQLQVKFRLFAAAPLGEYASVSHDDSLLSIPQSPDSSEAGVFESSDVASSAAPSTPTFHDMRAKDARTAALLSPRFSGFRPRKSQKSAALTIARSPTSGELLKSSKGGDSRTSMYREQLQFALMIGKVALGPSAMITESEASLVKADDTAPLVTIQYCVPYHFSTRLSVLRRGKSLERRAKRRLVRGQGNTRFAWVADFTGHSNVITSKFHDDAADYFDRGILILEVWKGSSENDHDALLGVAKIALREFGDFLRDIDLETFSQQAVPFAGVKGAHSIENLFTGKSVGLLRVQACIGTAEQILVWASSLYAVISLQAAVRGTLSRARLGIQRVRRTTRDQAARSPTKTVIRPDQPIDLSNSHLASAKAGAEATTIGHDASRVVSEQAAQVTKDKPRPPQQHLQLLPVAPNFVGVRFDIRHCWEASLRSGILNRRTLSTTLSTVIGCDVQCRLELRAQSVADKLSPVSIEKHFAIWWDATNQKLNSFCEVPLPCPTLNAVDSGGVGASTLAAANWGGLIEFSLRVDSGMFESSPDVPVIGEAVLSLDSIFFMLVLGHEARRAVANFDVPIRWTISKADDEESGSGFPQFIPLQLSFDCAPAPMTTPPSHMRVHVDTGYSDTTSDSQLPATISTPASRLQFVPAEVTLSVSIARISAFTSALCVRVETDTTSRIELLAIEHLKSMLSKKTHAVQVMFDIALRHESQRNQEGKTFETGSTRDPVARRWRTPSSSTLIADGTQGLYHGGDVNDRVCEPQAKLRILSDEISSLKRDSMEVTLMIICGECSTLHEVGTASIPTASVLFRPDGIQGWFPLRVGKAYAGAIDVRCHVDPGGAGDAPMPSERMMLSVLPPEVKSSSHYYSNTTKEPLSPTSPDDTNAFDSEPSPAQIQIAIEEARNVLVLDDDESGCDASSLGAFASWRVISGSSGTGSPMYHPVSRTHTVPLTTSARWYVSRSSRVKAAVWSSPVLEVSLWQRSQKEQREALPTVADHKVGVLDNSRLLGKARVDLSLLGRRWTFVDGWYHVLDARGVNRGQVKVRVDLLHEPEARDFNTAAVAASAAVEEAPICSPRRDSSFRQAVTPIHSDEADVQQRLLDFDGYSSAEGAGGEEGLPVILQEQTVDDEIAANDVGLLPQEQQEESKSAYSSGKSSVIGLDEPVSGIADEQDSVSSHSRSEVEDTNPAHDAQSAGEPLAIDTGMFMPITLASFGIDELELSPWSEASVRTPGSESTDTGDTGSPRFELVEESSDVVTALDDLVEEGSDAVAALDDCAAVRGAEDEIGMSASEDVSPNELSVLSSGEDSTQGLNTSNASGDFDGDDVVPESPRDVCGGEPDGASREAANGNVEVDEQALCTTGEDWGAESIGSNGAEDQDGDHVDADAVQELEAGPCGLDALQLAEPEVDGHVDGDVGEPRLSSSTTLLRDVGVQVDLKEASPEIDSVDGGTNKDVAVGTACDGINPRDEMSTRTVDDTELLLPSAIDPVDPESESYVADGNFDATDAGVADEDENPLATSGNESVSSCELDTVPATATAAADSKDESAAMPAPPAAELPVPPTVVYSNDKLDLIVDLLNEILVACMRNPTAPAVQSTPQVALDRADPPLRTAFDRSPDVRDAQTQVEEDFVADTASIGSSQVHEGELKQPGDEMAVDLASDGGVGSPRESSPGSVPGSSSTPTSSEEAFRHANDTHASRLDMEWRQPPDTAPASVSEATLRLHSAVPSTLPPRPLARPLSPPTMDRSSSHPVAAADRFALELSPLYDRKPLAPLVTTGTGLSSAKKPSVRLAPEKRTPLRFPHDSETERIARIMQGSITYWMKESEDGSTGSQDESEDSDSDSDYLF